MRLCTRYGDRRYGGSPELSLLENTININISYAGSKIYQRCSHKNLHWYKSFYFDSIITNQVWIAVEHSYSVTSGEGIRCLKHIYVQVTLLSFQFLFCYSRGLNFTYLLTLLRVFKSHHCRLSGS